MWVTCVCNLSSSADDFGRQKLAVEYIHRQLQEADEANFVDEQGNQSLFTDPNGGDMLS